MTKNTSAKERRIHVRFPSNAHVKTRITGSDGQDTEPQDSEAVNVSGGGLALLSKTRVEPGSTLQISVSEQSGDEESVTVEVIECLSLDSGEYVLRCRLTDGELPAQVILGW